MGGDIYAGLPLLATNDHCEDLVSVMFGSLLLSIRVEGIWVRTGSGRVRVGSILLLFNNRLGEDD
jgi:hypothetical protein